MGKDNQLLVARHAGIRGAWLGLVNPWSRVSEPELWAAWNSGRKMASCSAPGLSREFVWYNNYTFEGQLREPTISYPFDGLGEQRV